MKKWLLFAIKLVLTGLCLWWALSGAGIEREGTGLPGWSEIAWSWILAGTLLAGLTVMTTALRWWLLLLAQEVRISLWRAVELTLIGNLFNLFALGGVGGDAARIFLLIRDHPERKMGVTLAVLMDHLVGMVAMSLMFFAVTAGRFQELDTLDAMSRGILRFAWVFFIGGLAGIALMFVLASPKVHGWIHPPGREWSSEFLRRIPRTYDIFRRRWRHVLGSLAFSLLMLPAYYASFWCAARAVGSGVGVGPVFTAMPVVDALAAMPISIAGIGVREKVFQLLMNALTGMPTEIAVSASLIGFFCSLVWAGLGGLLFLRPRDRATPHEIEELTHEG